MVTIHREAGLGFVVFVDDHEPAHVHVVGDGAAKIDLLGAGGEPELVRSTGFKTADLRKAMRIVAERQSEFIEKWNAIHG